jgi:hypothetical protein
MLLIVGFLLHVEYIQLHFYYVVVVKVNTLELSSSY